MKTYRIQVRYDGSYWDFTTQAESIDDAAMLFIKKVNDGTLKPSDEGFYVKKKLFVTYEEVSNDTTQQAIRQEA